MSMAERRRRRGSAVKRVIMKCAGAGREKEAEWRRRERLYIWSVCGGHGK